MNDEQVIHACASLITLMFIALIVALIVIDWLEDRSIKALKNKFEKEKLSSPDRSPVG